MGSLTNENFSIYGILMFIKYVGPPPQEFCPSLYVRTRKGSLSDSSKAHARKWTIIEEHDYNILWKKLKT